MRHTLRLSQLSPFGSPPPPLVDTPRRFDTLFSEVKPEAEAAAHGSIDNSNSSYDAIKEHGFLVTMEKVQDRVMSEVQVEAEGAAHASSGESGGRQQSQCEGCQQQWVQKLEGQP